ncbi:hypothetical protein ACROYT_G014664 [Oculina patagonica]
MASNKTRTYIPLAEVVERVLDSDFEVDSGSEFGDLSSEEEEMIDAGCDPEVESAVVSEIPPGSPFAEPVPGPRDMMRVPQAGEEGHRREPE